MKKNIKLFIFGIFIALIVGCASEKALKIAQNVSEGIISFDGKMCLRSNDFFVIAKTNAKNEIVPIDTLKIDIPPSAKILDYNPNGRRIFFTDGDSIFAYDIKSGLLTTLTSGKFSEDVECGRSSYDGQYFAFAASPWNVGNIEFWRLVLVDAVEGGIVFYCDSLPSHDSFQWVKPKRLGYAEYRYVRGEIDTIGMFFDIIRNVKLPARDDGTEFLKVLCNPHISQDGKWALDIVEGKAVVRCLIENLQNREKP